MRKYKFNIMLVALFAFLFSSCDQEPKGAIYSGDSKKTSFLAASYSPAMTDTDGKKILVPIGRTGTEGTLSVPIKLTSTLAGYTTVFTVPNPAVFEAGKGSTDVVVNYSDLALINPSSLAISADATSSTGKDINVNLAFPFKLEIADTTLMSPNNIRAVSVNASKKLNFEAAGKALLNSVDGWYGETYEVDLQKAIGANVYKLKSPFGYRDVAFMISSDGKTVLCPNQIIYKHSTYGDVTMGTVKGSITGKVVTLTVGGYTVAAGSFGGGVEIITLP